MHTNRLARETSPYLLQHAHNPVDWFAWDSEAFEAARSQDKPIFLSVGYSTCYWCHVMERESFENPRIAEILNVHFIPVKVDREERPDVDDVYMAAVQAFTQATEGRASGGWPMSVFLEPAQLKPFYAGTYYPPQPAHGRPSFPQLLQFLADAWATKRQLVLEQADQFAAAVKVRLSEGFADVQRLSRTHVNQALDILLSIYDPQFGGFGGAPKFPQPVFLELILHCGWENPILRGAFSLTLNRMAMGGMYDQIGGGFHRYSTDAYWLVPHFEKMLYDQGQLVSVYAESAARTSDEFHALIARQTCEYVLREMTSPEGGFYSAQDAEVDHREGLNYLWRAHQVSEALRAAGAEHLISVALEAYGLDEGPNFTDPHHPEDGPKNVLFRVDRESDPRLDEINRILLAARGARKQPGVDDKVLVGWNGLMIAGLADAGRVLKEPRFVEAAQRAAAFVLERMRSASGGLLRTYRNEVAKIDAFLEDYALLAHGLLALHRAMGDPQWLGRARTLMDHAKQRFWDQSRGGYFDASDAQSELFVRTRGTHDGAMPSGNGVMVLNLLDLAERGVAGAWEDALATLRSMSPAIATNPVGAALATIGLKRVLEKDASAVSWGRAAPQAVMEPVRIDAIRGQAAREVIVRLEIAPGWHVNAHDVGDASLSGLEIRPVGGEALVEYPVGELYRGSIRVHSGSVEIPVRFDRDELGMRIEVRWQACSDQVCLAPASAVLEL